MTTAYVRTALVLLFILLLTPVCAFLCFGWRIRRRNIVDGFSNDAIELYFRAFHPHSHEQGPDRFDKYYNSQFGRKRFVVPLLLLATLSGLVLCWSALSVEDVLVNEAVGTGKLPLLAVIAVMGAYMWVLSDQIGKWYRSDISAGDVYWWCFRLVIAIPMGYAVQSIFTEKVALPLVFLLGAFPTTQLMAIVRRIARQKMGFSDSEDREVSELQSLQCVDTSRAEDFAAEGITTIGQLAYADPIRLTIRTGLSYSYVVDCICQALLWIYVEQDIAKLRKYGLRSSYEMLCLYLDLQVKDKQERAEQVLRESSKGIGYEETSFRNMLEQVSLDPYTQFLYLSWSGFSIEHFSPEQQKVFEFK